MTTPADRLIVALDTDDAMTLVPKLHESGVMFFKFNARSMMNANLFWDAIKRIERRDCSWFADLKIYDTADTVYNIARRAFDLGARFLTVHATPSTLEAAMRAKPPGDYAKVIAAGPLTDGPLDTPEDRFIPALQTADGLVCKVALVRHLQDYWTTVRRGKILVCPGIRPALGQVDYEGNPTNDIRDWDNHTVAYTTQAAVRAGADYLVVGRPIYNAPDPVTAARAIAAEIEEAAK